MNWIFTTILENLDLSWVTAVSAKLIADASPWKCLNEWVKKKRTLGDLEDMAKDNRAGA